MKIKKLFFVNMRFCYGCNLSDMVDNFNFINLDIIFLKYESKKFNEMKVLKKKLMNLMKRLQNYSWKIKIK